jgi:uncharacterized repeat protein (TIGR01451 family)
MKKTFLLLILSFISPNFINAQFVNIPDANFATKLQQLFPSCMNGNLMDTTCSGIVNATSLSIVNLNLSDLTGIQYFDNLNSLDCSYNYLPSLPPLPNSLMHLECALCDLTSLPVLPNSLQQLICDYNLLIALPTLPDSLKLLKCNSNYLSSLPPIPNSLIYLECSGNILASLPVLADSLQTLLCSFNQISILPSLPNSITNLDCLANLLSDLPTLPNALTTLSCQDNLLNTLPVLPTSLTFLDCSSNQLSNLPAIPNNLTVLDCGFNQITSIPAVPSLMEQFSIYNNNVSCMVNLPEVSNPINSGINDNLLTCVPNQTNYSLGLPLCMDNDLINNPNNCPGVNITGFVYTDQNSNCNFNLADLPTENIPVKLLDSQNNLLATSYTVVGVYSFASLLPDTFQIKIEDNSLPVALACGQSNNQTVTLDSANQTIADINFPVVCDVAYDIEVHSVTSQGWVFPGQSHALNTNITNNESWFNINCGSSNNSGPVTISLTGPVTFIAPASGALIPTVSGNTFTYAVADFNSLTPSSFGLILKTDTTAQAGEQICVHVEINSTALDADTTNNVYDFCYQVVNSYDPNMKEVYPVNVLPGYDDWFTYTIHFQNTGNAPAFNIRLRDTLDANLDINSFEVRGYSHPAQISINGNILTVRFNNIMLPDSTTDYEGSMGYFQYRLKPLPNLPNGTQIENTAYIYFDYNAPIITNTTQNNFEFPVKVNNLISENQSFVLYPNPSAGIFMFKEHKHIKTVEVFNMLGELVLSQGNAKIINLQGFPKGIYVARVNGTQVCRLVKE